jgi:hypothetical protein
MLYCDNKAAINIANNLIQHDRTKHVEIDRHFIKEKIDDEMMYLPFVRTTEIYSLKDCTLLNSPI